MVRGRYDWCVQTLKAHAADKRPETYTREQLERAQTKDDLWNAAQQEMVLTGKMHGFLRMCMLRIIDNCVYICSVCMSNAHGTFVCVCNTYIVRGRYWAKKILEWTGPEEVEEGSSPPQRALATAIYLNDKYLLLFCSPHCLSVRPSV